MEGGKKEAKSGGMLRGAAARLMRPLMRPLVQSHAHPCGARVMSSLAGSKTLDGLRDAFVRANPKHTTCVLPSSPTNMPALTNCPHSLKF